MDIPGEEVKSIITVIMHLQDAGTCDNRAEGSLLRGAVCVWAEHISRCHSVKDVPQGVGAIRAFHQ